MVSLCLLFVVFEFCCLGVLVWCFVLIDVSTFLLRFCLWFYSMFGFAVVSGVCLLRLFGWFWVCACVCFGYVVNLCCFVI